MDVLVTRGLKSRNTNQYFSVNYASFVESLEKCLCSHIKSQDTEILTHALTILATHG